MANNTLYSNLKQYILRRLGYPVNHIEVTDDQLEDCIDEAVAEFIEYHSDGVNVGFVTLSIQEDVTEYELDETVQSVLKILTQDSLTLDSDDPLLIKSSFYVGNGNYDYQQLNLIDVEVFRQQFKMVEDTYQLPILFDFNTTTKKLTLMAPPTTDATVYLKVYQSEDDISPYLKDRWLKKYSVALARLQWGDNLGKFEGGNLPGGAQFNYGTIMERAQTEIDKLQEELEDRYSLPIDPLIA